MRAPRKYAEGSRQPGELRPTELAKSLGVYRMTVLNWLARGVIIPPGSARRDPLGRYWINSGCLPAVREALEARTATWSQNLDATY